MSSPPSSLPVRQPKKHIQYPGHISRQQHAHTYNISLSSTSHIKAKLVAGVGVVLPAAGTDPANIMFACTFWGDGGGWGGGEGASQQEQHNRAATQQTSVLRSHMRISRMGALVCLDRYSPDVYLYIVAARAAGSHQNDRVCVVCTQWCCENFYLGFTFKITRLGLCLRFKITHSCKVKGARCAGQI